MVFDPSITQIYTTPGKDLNVFPGIVATRLPPVPDEQVPELIERIRYHLIEIMANGKVEDGEWLIKWCTNIVQRPEVKTGVPLVFYGKQGAGKGIFFEFMRQKVLGDSITSQCERTEADLFSRFSNKHVHRLLIQVDEGEALARFAGAIKNLSTNSHINYEIKGINPITTLNFANIVITTNVVNPVMVETSDRRFALFNVSDKKIFDQADPFYGKDLHDYLQRPEVARAWYQYLMQIDLSGNLGNMQRTRPKTDYYVSERNKSIPIVARFLSALINTNKYRTNAQDEKPEIAAKNFYKDFSSFVEFGGFSEKMSLTNFGLAIKVVNGVTKIRHRSGFRYVLDYDVIKCFLVSNNEFDDDAICE